MITVLGVFTDQEKVSLAIEKLKEKGFKPEDISVVMRDQKAAKELGSKTGTDIAGGAVSGATSGAIIGGLAGLVAAFALPGLGAFFIGGPVATSLGLTSAAASTVSGAATGAVAGGILGALMGFGLSENEARYYETKIEEGAILVAVPVDETSDEFAKHILEDYNASDIKVFAQSEDKIRTSNIRNRNADRSDNIDTHLAEDEYLGQTYTSAGMKGGKSTDEDVEEK